MTAFLINACVLLILIIKRSYILLLIRKVLILILLIVAQVIGSPVSLKVSWGSTCIHLVIVVVRWFIHVSPLNSLLKLSKIESIDVHGVAQTKMDFVVPET